MTPAAEIATRYQVATNGVSPTTISAIILPVTAPSVRPWWAWPKAALLVVSGSGAREGWQGAIGLAWM